MRAFWPSVRPEALVGGLDASHSPDPLKAGAKAEQPVKRSWARRVARILAGCAGGVILLLLLGAGGLLWRLTQGPLDITALSRYGGPVLLYKDPQDHHKNIALHWDRVAIQWFPGREGAPSALEVRARGLQTRSEAGQVFDRVSEVKAAFDLSALWRGSVRLLRGDIKGGSVSLVQKNHAFWALGGALPLEQKETTSSGPLKFDFSSFRALTVRNLVLTLERQGIRPTHLVLGVPQFAAYYRQEAGWEGHSAFSLDQVQGSRHSHVDFALSLKPGAQGKTVWSMRSSALMPSDYSLWAPGAAATLAMIELPLTLESSGTFSRRGMGGAWEEFTLHLKAGAGLYHQEGADPLRVEAADFTFYGHKKENGAVGITVKPGSTLFLHDDANQQAHFAFTGHMEADDLLAPKNIKIVFAFHVPRLDFAHLPSVWPITVAKGGRRWMGANMTSGIAENFTLKVTLASKTGWDDLDDTNLEGDLWGHDLTVYWLKPLPPVQHVEAYAHFLSADALQIDLKDGHMDVQGGKGIDVPKGRVLLTGLAKPDQMGNITLALKGPLPGFLSVLAHPRLHLLSRYSIALTHVTGSIDGELGVVLPLDANVLMSEIGFNSQARFAHVGFDNKITGSVKDGQGSFHVTSKEISTDLKLKIRQIPLSLSYRDSFEKKPFGVVNRSLKARAAIDVTHLGALGLNVPPRVASGVAIAQAAYEQKEIAEKRQQGDLNLSLDLTPAALSAVIWKKDKGAQAQLFAHARWLNGELRALDKIAGQGPGLTLKGRSLVTKGEITGLVVNPLHIGRNEGNLTVKWPASHSSKPDYDVFFDGSSLDLSPLLGTRKADQKVSHKEKRKNFSKAQSTGPLLSPITLPKGNWAVALKARKFYYKDSRFFSTFLAGAHWSRKSLQELHISLARPYPFNLVIQDSRHQQGRKSFLLASQDIGAMLASLDLVKRLEGGRLMVKGYFEPQGQQNVLGLGLGPFYGRAELGDIALLRPPAFLKLATLLTPSEWGQVGTDRLGHIKASVDFSLNDRDFAFQKGQLGNAVLGGRFRGAINLRNRDFEMQGTVSPFFSYKKPDKIPFQTGQPSKLEKSFSLIAVTYKIDGKIDDPHVKVSPFSVFSPTP